jgi:hypothetical protein
VGGSFDPSYHRGGVPDRLREAQSVNIKAKLVGRITTLTIGGIVHHLNEEDVRRVRSEMNRVLQRIYNKRKQNARA